MLAIPVVATAVGDLAWIYRSRGGRFRSVNFQPPPCRAGCFIGRGWNAEGLCCVCAHDIAEEIDRALR